MILIKYVRMKNSADVRQGLKKNPALAIGFKMSPIRSSQIIGSNVLIGHLACPQHF